MSFQASFFEHDLVFKFPAGTSRGVLNSKKSYFIKIVDSDTGFIGIGEAGPLNGLSPEYGEDLQPILNKIILDINNGKVSKEDFILNNRQVPSSVKFALETAFLDVSHKESFHIYANDFYKGVKNIPINGLIWMGDMDFMKKQLYSKLEEGYNCIKFKIGALEIDEELKLIRELRKIFPSDKLIIRVDANGAFSKEEALRNMQILYDLEVHSIEQPIPAGNLDQLSDLVKQTKLPVALDEELIGIRKTVDKYRLLEEVKPDYLVLKPTLHGGLYESEEWIKIAEECNIAWWITSALESNIGLNAVAQFTAQFDIKMHQGLGTGQLYTNNMESPLEINSGFIKYNPASNWDIKSMSFKPL